MTLTPWMRSVALVLALGLMAAACGDTGDGTDGTDDATDPAGAATTPAATADPTEADDGTAVGDGFRLGYLLPETGQLAFLSPPMIEAIQLAVEELNDAGGVLGETVRLTGADEAGDATIASQSVGRLLGEGVNAIVGAAASGMSLAVIDQVTGARVVQCSPSNTSPTFTTYPDDGYYFRTAPSDAFQGQVLAEAMLADGHTDVAIIARADDYGQGLADVTATAIEEAGGSVVAQIIYDPEAATFDAEIQQVITAGAQAVALIAFDESAQILQTMIENGLGPGEFPVYGAESVKSPDRPTEVDPADPTVLDGLKGTAPAVEGVADEGFLQRLQERNPDLSATLFGAETYDCAVIIALAATAADSTDPSVFVSEMVGVTRDGQTCTSYPDCVELLEAGEDIDYDGASGPVDFVDSGEPGRGVYEIWEFQDGEIVTVESGIVVTQ